PRTPTGCNATARAVRPRSLIFCGNRALAGVPPGELVQQPVDQPHARPDRFVKQLRVRRAGVRARRRQFLSILHLVAHLDGFTSVVDRTVAKVGSAAVAKAVRKAAASGAATSKRFVAVTEPSGRGSIVITI